MPFVCKRKYITGIHWRFSTRTRLIDASCTHNMRTSIRAGMRASMSATSTFAMRPNSMLITHNFVPIVLFFSLLWQKHFGIMHLWVTLSKLWIVNFWWLYLKVGDFGLAKLNANVDAVIETQVIGALGLLGSGILAWKQLPLCEPADHC